MQLTGLLMQFCIDGVEKVLRMPTLDSECWHPVIWAHLLYTNQYFMIVNGCSNIALILLSFEWHQWSKALSCVCCWYIDHMGIKTGTCIVWCSGFQPFISCDPLIQSIIYFLHKEFKTDFPFFIGYFEDWRNTEETIQNTSNTLNSSHNTLWGSRVVGNLYSNVIQ